MNPTDIIARLQQHERDHAEHKAVVQGWLIEAGFHPDVTPCRVVLTVDRLDVWCGNARRSDTRAIELTITADGYTSAMLVSYGGHRTYLIKDAETPVEALRALAASGKVPRALLKEAP